MQSPVLLITPPFTQLNTPYPATAYIKGFLNVISQPSEQIDLSIATVLSLFTKKNIAKMFDCVDTKNLSERSQRLYSLREEYIATIEEVIDFLQGRKQSLAQRIADDAFLPKGDHFFIQSDLDLSFGNMGFRDKARHFCTLYLEDLAAFITENIDPYFGFSRYAEQLGRYASSFDQLSEALHTAPSFIDELMLDLLRAKMEECKPSVVAITIPFPGNLYSAFRCGQWIKANHPSVHIIMGGGFANTELRSLSESRVFDYTDYVVLDDGEEPLKRLLAYLNGEASEESLMRTFLRVNNKVEYINDQSAVDLPFSKTGCPDYTGLDHQSYLSVIEVLNPMHKLWSDGYWNKLTLAHGCYWGKCAFCDGSLDYIKRYDPAKAALIVDRMEQVIAQTGETGFHFVDEAAPPKLLKELAIEILRRRLQVTWWTNIRFEKNFTADLCRLLAASGCIAVSGGLEIASDRILKLINKGVNVDQVARVANHFTQAGVMVHAYLMYGFPTQTKQETIDSLENVRQLFEQGIVHSAFWHRFAMTAHSPIGLNPEYYNVEALPVDFKGFADNDRLFEDNLGANHDQFAEGLRKSLFNYLHGVGFDFPLSDWFDTRMPRPTVPHNRIAKALKQDDETAQSFENRQMLWIGGSPLVAKKQRKGKALLEITIHNRSEEICFTLPQPLADQFLVCFDKMGLRQPQPYKVSDFRADMSQALGIDLEEFLDTEAFSDLRETSLLLL